MAVIRKKNTEENKSEGVLCELYEGLQSLAAGHTITSHDSPIEIHSRSLS